MFGARHAINVDGTTSCMVDSGMESLLATYPEAKPSVELLHHLSSEIAKENEKFMADRERLGHDFAYERMVEATGAMKREREVITAHLVHLQNTLPLKMIVEAG